MHKLLRATKFHPLIISRTSLEGVVAATLGMAHEPVPLRIEFVPSSNHNYCTNEISCKLLEEILPTPSTMNAAAAKNQRRSLAHHPNNSIIHKMNEGLISGGHKSAELTPTKTNNRLRRKHRSFFDETATPIRTMRGSGNGEMVASIDKPKHEIYREVGKEIATVETLRTASLSTASPETITPGTKVGSMTIVTDLSNLTESPEQILRHSCPTELDTSGYTTPGDQVLESMKRLRELELKRNTLRHQRFRLEQRLHSFHRSSARLGRNKRKEDSRTVVDWKYHRTTSDKKNAIAYYSGCLNADGIPHDEGGTFRFGDGQVYEGSILEGKRHGFGTNQWPDGQKYRGDWSGDSRHGMGTHSWKDGRTVTGGWKDGHLHGKVFFRWPNGAMFDGIAKMGKKEGKGVNTRADGTVYNGNFKNGKENGFGTLIRPDGVKYRGDFRDGLKDGYGVMLWKNRTYDGEWSVDKPHGRGRVVWSNGAVFTGQFQKGNYSGLGVYTWPSGKKFVGRWENGVKSGHGLQTWPNGKKYDGEYINGCKEGYGRMTWPDGSIYCGGFKRNKRCGRGVQTDAFGSVVHCGVWKDDVPIPTELDPTNRVLQRNPSRFPLLMPRTKARASEIIASADSLLSATLQQEDDEPKHGTKHCHSPLSAERRDAANVRASPNSIAENARIERLCL